MVAFSNAHGGSPGATARARSGGGLGVSIVLCTTEDDEPLLANVIDRLHREGLSPGVVAGIDADTQKLGNHLDTNDDATVYVICVSRSLTSSTAGRLEGIFAVRHGPMHRCVSVDFGAGDHDAALREIRAAAADLAFGESAGSSTPEDETMITQSRARDVIDPDLLRAVTTPAASRPLDSGGFEITEEARGADVPISSEARRQVVENVKAKVQAKVSPLTETSEIPVATGMEPASPPPRQRSAGPVIGLVVGGVVLLGAVAALLVLKPWASEEGAPAADTPAQKAPPPAPEITPDPASQTESASGESGSSEHDTGSAPPAEGDGEATGAEPGAGGEAEPAGKGDSASVTEAIKSGEMRALDLLLVLEQSDSLTWTDARDHCKDQRIAGFQDWRMPSSKELWKLRNARILNSRSAYWSSTLDTSEDAEPDTILGVDRGKVAVLNKTDDQPHVVCVRDR